MSTSIDEILKDEDFRVVKKDPVQLVVLLLLGFYVARMWVRNFDNLINEYITEPRHFIGLTIILTIVFGLLLRDVTFK